MLRSLSSRAAGVAAVAIAAAGPAWLLSRSSVHAEAPPVGGTAGAASDRRVRAEKLANTPPTPALTPTDFTSFTLAAKEQLTHDTARYTFALPRENDELGLTVASCLVLRATVDGAYRMGAGVAARRRRAWRAPTG